MEVIETSLLNNYFNSNHGSTLYLLRTNVREKEIKEKEKRINPPYTDRRLPVLKNLYRSPKDCSTNFKYYLYNIQNLCWSNNYSDS